jgi:hypothetical protein
MTTNKQCGLCLSCGAPFPPSTRNVALFGRRANLSIVYIDHHVGNNPDLNARYHNPCFSAPVDASHMFHESHHQAALDYMCNHHTGDNIPAGGTVNIGVTHRLPDKDGAFPFYKGGRSKKEPHVATWDKPEKEDRLDFGVLLDHIKSKQTNDLDTAFAQNLNQTYLLCKSCNAIMTSVAYMRYIVGFSTNADRNPHGCIIPADKKPIKCYAAVTARADVKRASKAWYRKKQSPEQLYPTRASTEDPVSPHIAYYLHMCLPFRDPADPDVFDDLIGRNSGIAGRSTYTELCWIILMIACLATHIEKGSLHGDHKPSHGQHQQYGVLDIYVSFFIWRLCEFDYGPELARSGIDFVQWHQKYFWEAVHCRGMDKYLAVVGLAAYGSVEVNSRALVQDICAKLMQLYMGPIKPLIMLITGSIQPEIDTSTELGKDQMFVKNFFLPLSGMRTLMRVAGEKVDAHPPHPSNVFHDLV